MKNVVYILTSGVLLILIISVGFLGRQISNRSTLKPQASTTPESIKVTEAPTLSYQILSPAKIKKDNVTFEASVELLSCAELSFDVNATLPSDYPTQLPPGNEGHYPYIFEDWGITLSSPNVSLKPDPSFGGGGGADINGVHIRGQGQGYFIDPPLVSGQNIHITAHIKFNELFGITEPVPFEIDLDAGQCQ